MSQSLAQNLVHLIIFSTKQRKTYLHTEIRPEVNSYLAGILRNLESLAILVNCVTDHVHILFALSKNLALSKVVEEVKKSSSKWIKTQRASLHDFHWQNGYAAFSVSQSVCPKVRDYIEQQELHHQKKSFQEELREFFNRHGIKYDERYVWD